MESGSGSARKRYARASRNRQVQHRDAPRPSKTSTSDDPLAPGLYVTGTPIGNLGDLSFRALEVLGGVDVIAAEDTRTTKRLLGRYGLSTRLISYHDHNASTVRPRIIQRLKKGETVALVSDAGMPLISDPGFKLVAAVKEQGIPVHSVPGPSAVIAALSVAGLATDRFLFLGFLPTKAAERRRVLAEAGKVKATLVIFESAKRLPQSLSQMAELMVGREAAICRELTKKFEEVRRGTLEELAAHYGDAGSPKGEIVIVIEPGDGAARALSADELDDRIREALQDLSPSRAAARVALETGISKREVYARVIVLAEQA